MRKENFFGLAIVLLIAAHHAEAFRSVLPDGKI